MTLSADDNNSDGGSSGPSDPEDDPTEYNAERYRGEVSEDATVGEMLEAFEASKDARESTD